MSFENLNLNPAIVKALHKCGYMDPTPIQEQAIPRVLAGKDLIGTAQTGTGKTAAFVLPALHYLMQAPKQPLPSILILVPVRELATQITDAIRKYSTNSGIKIATVLGGMPYHAQMRQLSQPVDFLVATPGRLIDYIKRGSVNLSQVKMLVLDEADRMLDMGFIDDVKLISRHLPKERQTLLFTATMDERIGQLARTLLREPEHITVKGKSITLEKIKQVAYITDDLLHKNKLLEHILNNESIFKAIIFSATKHHADKLARQLRDNDHSVDVLHGDIRQHKRNRILAQFRQGEITFLVATDVAARGIDISDVSHVINYDIPRTGEDYVHRIGRTGRAGKEGIAISFIAANEGMQLKRIERFINNTITQDRIEGLEAKRSLSSSSSDHKSKKSWRGGKPSSNRSNHRSSRPWADSKPGERTRSGARSDERSESGTRTGERSGYAARTGHRSESGARTGERSGYAARTGHRSESGARTGERSGYAARTGHRSESGARTGERSGYARTGERSESGARTGERSGYAARTGERSESGARTGERSGYAARTGQRSESGARTGERSSYAARTGQRSESGARTGERSGYAARTSERSESGARTGERSGAPRKDSPWKSSSRPKKPFHKTSRPARTD
jgi:superfamily II DNA/RNA helicase